MIYVIAEAGDDTGPVKIGVTTGPPSHDTVKERLSSIQCGNHRTLEVIAMARGEAELERLLHRRFRAHRLRGEWFRREGEVLAFVTENRCEPAAPPLNVFMMPYPRPLPDAPASSWFAPLVPQQNTAEELELGRHVIATLKSWRGGGR